MAKRTKPDPVAVVKGLLLTRGRGFDTESFLAAITECFGGPQGLAREYHTVYRDATGHVKARLLECLVKTANVNDSRRLKAGQGDLGDLTDEDLRQVLRDAVSGRAGERDDPQRPPDAAPGPAAPPAGPGPAAG